MLLGVIGALSKIIGPIWDTDDIKFAKILWAQNFVVGCFVDFQIFIFKFWGKDRCK